MRKKSILVLTLSIMMAVIMTLMPSVQVAAEQAKDQGEYITEVKVGVGETAEEAKKSA